MTKRDLFRVLIKIFGLYSVILTLFTIVPASISSLMYLFEDMNMTLVLILIAAVLIPVGFFLVLLFRTDSIIDLLQLDKGFDDEHIQLGNLDNESILKLAIIIIGGFLIIDNIPDLLFDLINAFKYKANYSTVEGTSLNYFRMTTCIINCIIGYLLLINYKWLSGFFAKK